MIKTRLWGEKEELSLAVEALKKDKKFEVLSVSSPYKDRGDSSYYRVYVEMKLK